MSHPHVVWELPPDSWKRRGWAETPAAIMDWIRAHDVDPVAVSAAYPVTVEVHDGRQWVCYREVVLDKDGWSRIDDFLGEVATFGQRVPLTVAPPDLDSL